MSDAGDVLWQEVTDRLREIADREMAANPEAEVFMDWPDRWWERPHWRCINGHVSTMYLKSEALGYNACLAGGCREHLHLTFPEDVDGPLPT